MQKLLPFNDDLLKSEISSLYPTKFDLDKLANLAKRYSNIIQESDFTDLYTQLEQWELSINDLKAKFIENKEDLQLFYNQSEIKKKYPKIWNLATTLLAFPHSIAEAERLFSQVKLIKTDRRNSLSTDTLEALVLLKQNKINLTEEPQFTMMKEKYLELKSEISQHELDLREKRKFSEITQKKMSSCDNLLSSSTFHSSLNSEEGERPYQKRVKTEDLKKDVANGTVFIDLKPSERFESKIIDEVKLPDQKDTKGKKESK